ncbi:MULTISPECIES: cupin domain-containing protein [Cohnella]|uniref:cupin domain-containing protein n=1 Tax=Cohnella TaxID=329857 RepID=UPI0009B9E700|nr:MULTISPECIES: cupin domain-containing protein [Cohnella]MBN2980369.1 cupin domain-containing protein [Cohnella algarum]
MDIRQPLAGKADSLPVYKISPKDTNKFVLLSDGDFYPFMNCVEIFDVGGKTPPNTHKAAFEHFYVLHGTGIAIVGDREIPISAGAHLVVPPGFNHQVENTGDSRLYVFTTMIPDEDFSALIKRGVPASLDEEDLRILCGKE